MDRSINICILGDSDVGKTSIIRSFSKDKSTSFYKYDQPTNFTSAIFLYEDFEDEKWIEYNFCDISGEQFGSKNLNHLYEDTNGIFLVVDATRSSTFSIAGLWLKDFLIFNEKEAYNIPCVLLINKTEKLDDRGTRDLDIFLKVFCGSYDINAVFKISVLENLNITRAMERMYKLIVLLQS